MEIHFIMSYIFQNFWDKNKRNKNRIGELSRFSQKENKSSFMKIINVIPIDTTLVYYDLYKFLGTTYSVGTVSPTPISAYDAELISGTTYAYTFIYPIYDFQVPVGEAPEDYTDGATPWEFQTTIAIVKSKIMFPNMPDWGVDGAKIISYLYKEDGTVVDNLKFVLREGSQNLDELSVDYGEFHRWVNLLDDNGETNGYEFEYYCIFPIPDNQQIFLNANLYVYNLKNYYHVQSTKI